MLYFKQLNVKEWVTIIYFCWVVGICLIFRENRPYWYIFVIAHSGTIWLIVWLSNQNWFDGGKWHLVRDLYPYFFALTGYKEAACFVQLIFQKWFDGVLIKIDLAMFGTHPTVYLAEHSNLLLNEYANFSYFSYFVYVPILIYFLWKNKPGSDFEGYMGGLVMAYNFSYIFFALLPASSPRFALPEFGLIAPENVRLDGFLFTSIIDLFMDKGAMRGGAFPSVHCCVSTVFLLNAYKYFSKKAFWLSLFFVFCMYWSTVYGRYHYVIDVLAGIGTGVLFAWAGHYFQAKINRFRSALSIE